MTSTNLKRVFFGIVAIALLFGAFEFGHDRALTDLGRRALTALSSVGTKSTGGSDSPIVVSDGSTHLKHRGSLHDFHLGTDGHGNVQAQIYTKSTTLQLICVSGGFDNSCGDGTTLATLTGNWSIKTYSGTNASGSFVMTIASTDNKTVTATFQGGFPVDLEEETSDDDAQRGSGISQNAPNYDFKSFTYSNNGGGVIGPYNCTLSGNILCKIKIIN